MKVVISVPHYKYPDDYDKKDHPPHYHPCDWIAGPVAKTLTEKLQKIGYDVKLVLGDIVRTERDLNRPEGRFSDFRKQVNKAIKEDGPTNLLIDCHSYPKNSVKYQKWEVVVFKSPYDKQNIALSMFQILQNLGLNVGFQDAFTRDCVLNDAVKDGQVAVLIEHNEDIDLEMLTDFEVQAIDEFLTGIKPKMSTILQVVKESFKK
jgi:hypothetical protein